MTGCGYNFIRFSMCSYNFNVAVRISINPHIIGDILRHVKYLDSLITMPYRHFYFLRIFPHLPYTEY